MTLKRKFTIWLPIINTFLESPCEDIHCASCKRDGAIVKNIRFNITMNQAEIELNCTICGEKIRILKNFSELSRAFVHDLFSSECNIKIEFSKDDRKEELYEYVINQIETSGI
jgi:hypothetical protein